MPDRPKDLPNFTNPPVHEVLLSIQFAALTGFRSYLVGKLWDRVRARYPKISEHAPLNSQFETFGSAVEVPDGGATLQFEALLQPPMPRFWFEAADRSLMQVQQDRLVHNWRSSTAEKPIEYPRYEKVLDAFLADFRAFEEFVHAEDLGTVVINQCEISYVNTIFVPEIEDPYKAVAVVTPT